MEPILRALPFFDIATTVPIRDAHLPVRAFQIVLWVGIARIGEDRPETGTKFFPAILDTGHNDNFAITPRHLRDWAGMEWNTLPPERGVERRYQNVPVPHRRANIWVCPNQYGWRDHIAFDLRPALLELDAGIAVYGDGMQVGVRETADLIGPRLPILGLRALSMNRVKLEIDSNSRRVWLHRLLSTGSPKGH